MTEKEMKKDLLDILEDLGDDEFENFKWHLKDEKVGDIPPIKEIKLSKAKMRDVVDLMVQNYTFPGAVHVFKTILKKISRNDLVRKLPNISSGAEDQERVLQRKLHTFSLPPGELHLTWSRTNSPQNPKPTDQPSTSHSQTFRKESTNGLEKIFKTDIFLLNYLRDNHKAFKDLERQLSAIGCRVELNFDEEEAVVRGDIEKGPGGASGGAAERWEPQVDEVFISLTESYLCYHVVQPKRVKILLQDISFVTDDVKVYTKGDHAVVVGDVQSVKERIAILGKRLLTRKELPVVEKQFKLVEEEFSREICAHCPEVKILCGNLNLIILEGPDKQVQLGVTKLEELIKKVKEKRVKLSTGLMTFMTSSGFISRYQARFQQSLRNPVALEVGSDLVLSSLSSAALDEAEAAVLRELSEVTVQLQGATAVSPDLDRVKEILIKAKNEANLRELRVHVSFIPVPRQAAVTKVQLVGYSENVNKLKEVLQDYQMNQIERLQNEVQKIHISDKIRQAGGAGEKLLYHKTTQDSCDSSMTTGFNSCFARQNGNHLEYLQKITGKTKEEFTVVLPHSCKTTDYPANCSLGKLLHDLAEEERMMPPNKSFADQQPTEMESVSGECHQLPIKCGRYIKQFFTDPKKSLKGNHSDNKVSLVLLGMSGTGKSASGNTILGKKQFLSKADSMPVTTECQVAETEIIGTCVRVIDTPDIFDDEIKSSVKNQHVTKCKQLLQSEPCVFLLVIQVSRFTNGERDILRKLEKAFGSRAKEQTVILFTHGEYLQRANMSLEGFLQDCQPELKNIVDQCGRRCVVFENKTPRQHQVTDLMQTVNKMLNKYQNQ